MSADPPGLMLSLTLGATKVMLHLIRYLTIFFIKLQTHFMFPPFKRTSFFGCGVVLDIHSSYTR